MAQIKLLPPPVRSANISVHDHLNAVVLKMPEKISPACYQTDERYFCGDKCQWSKGCKSLKAEWLRRK